MRAEDIIRCARFLADYETSGSGRAVHLTSVGRVGPPALHAAALEPELFASAELTNCLGSWSDVVHTPLAKNQFVNVVHGALVKYDLADLIEAVPEGKISVADPLNAMEEPAR